MKIVYMAFLATILLSNVSANTKKADRLYGNWEYYKASKLYEKEAAKNPSADVYFKLGECFRMMNSYKLLEQAAYDKVNAYGVYHQHIFYLNYGQVLKNNGKNEEAKNAFRTYAELEPNDPRGNFYYLSVDIIRDDHYWDEPIKVNNVQSLNSENADFSPVKYKDGIVFTTSRKTSGHSKIYSWTGANYLDLYYAKSTSDKMKFENIGAFGSKKSNKKYHDGPACFSANYDTLYISRVDKTLRGKMKRTLNIERNQIFSTTQKDGEWTKGIPFEYNNDTFSVANPFLSKNGTQLYFVSDMPGGYGETDIYYCTKQGDKWSEPKNMGPNINTFNREKFPMLDSLDNFYFSSDGYQGLGGMDICVSICNNNYYQKAIPMKSPINSTYDDYSIYFTQAERAGYISSNRVQTSKGDADIYYFNINNDKVDKKLVASIYTIGYRKPMPAPKPIAAVVEPAPYVPAPPIVFNPSVLIQHFIYFDFDKSELRENAVTYLDSIVVFLNTNPNSIIKMTAHCDERGSAKYNMNLSVKRAKVTKEYLIKQGINKDRISAKGLGLTRMVNKCENGVICTELEHQQNRRVEFYFE